jgi:putative salt-induced outer membrane protein YdiY
MHKLGFLILLLYFCFLRNGFTDEIKTIDGDIIKGEVVKVDEEYLVVREGGDTINFIQWRIISLISRGEEIIIVNHEGDRKKFTILKSSGSLSAENIDITKTDTVSSIYPKEATALVPLFIGGAGHQIQTDNNSIIAGDTVSPETDTQQKKSWSGNIDAGLTIQRGNRDALTTSVKTSFVWERRKDSVFFNTLVLYGITNDVKSADEQKGTVKYERTHGDRMYSFHQQSVEHDEVERLNLRSITSSGFGYRFTKRENLKYRSEIGPSFIYENFKDGSIQTTPGLKIGNYLDWQIHELTSLYAKVDFLPAVEKYLKWRAESDIGLRQRLNKHLSWNISWINQYTSDPGVEGISRNDAIILSTIGYNF